MKKLCKYCLEEGIEKEVTFRDMCSKHSSRYYRYNDPRKSNRDYHGMTGTLEYHIWNGMKSRCFNKNNSQYKYYGGRGIIVCERWMKFSNFLEDMGKKPEGMSIDRINPKKGYYKENCRWTDAQTQSINQGIRKDNKTGCKGVSFCNRRKKFITYIGGKYIGAFKTKKEAIKIRIQAELKYWGEVKQKQFKKH
jgi:hypothetical protein